MEIIKGIEIIDLSLWIKDEQTLIIGDLHIGYEESLNNQGVLVPRSQLNQLKERLIKILDKVKPKRIIITGDIKHEFSRISAQEWNNTLNIIDFLSKYCQHLILIEGNHDNILGPIASKRSIVVQEYLLTKEIYISHGHKIPENNDFAKSKTIIIGHEHPAISFKEGSRVERFKCFLKGKYNNKTLIVHPSFNLFTEGTDILKEDILSPFLDQNLDDFNIFIVADKIYDFGKVKKLRENND